MSKEYTIPRTFIWRRLHSLAGLWLVVFLVEHLLTNSQAALLLGENGQEFVRLVDLLHNLPFLHVIEIFLFAIPIGLHAALGIKYALTSKPNTKKSDGSSPSLPQYSRNRAYTWQRISSWILLFLLAFHVIKFRFIEYPSSVNYGVTSSYFVKIDGDAGLASVAQRLGVCLYKKGEFHKECSPIIPEISLAQERIEKMEKFSLKDNQFIAETKDFGTATLMSVRDTFKNYFYCFLYTIFVLTACFHAFNGLWTFMLSWGLIIRSATQTASRRIAFGVMAAIASLGLISIWGTYWLNLRS